MGFSVNLSVVRCLAVPDSKDEDFGRSAPFYLFPTMKRIFTLILLSMIAFSAILAEITWTLSDDGTLTISGTGGIEINPWYSQREKIKKIVIGNEVTSIGSHVFNNCSELTSISIPNSVTNIGYAAFRGCSILTSIKIPNSVTTIGESAFEGCSGLTSIIIPNSVTSISRSVFNGCSGLTSVTIPNSVTNIEHSAFRGCSRLTSVTIPNSVTSIGLGAFWDCSGLTSFTIPNSVTSIESSTFYNCLRLTSITIPNSVTRIGDYAFYGCSGLTSVAIPNSVTSIEIGAFYGCSGLTSIKIPNSVTDIEGSAFSFCSGLTSIIVEEGNQMYDSKNNCNAIIKKESNTLIAGSENTIIPNSVTTIGKYAFNGRFGLTSITIPNYVEVIGVAAFQHCTGLTSITIPSSVMSIKNYAFNGCSSLTFISIPNSVTSIGNSAFYGCSGLTSITCEASTPPGCGVDCFYNVPKNIPVYVPANSVDSYKEAKEWKDFTNIQAIPHILIDGTAYNNNSQLNGREIFYTRIFNNTYWQALYIPFSLKYEDWKDGFEIAYINGVRQLDKDDNGTIDETIMDVIKIKSGSTSPNMPYLIKAKKTGENTFSVSNATLYPAEENSVDCSTTIAKYTFTGTYNAIPSATMIANGYYAMGGGDLIQSDGSNDLKPYRWYMKVESRNPSYNASNAAKTITINVIDDEGETTTGVEELQMTNYKSPVYDLNGRKVNENNLKPGIYVKNGKKFVVK